MDSSTVFFNTFYFETVDILVGQAWTNKDLAMHMIGNRHNG